MFYILSTKHNFVCILSKSRLILKSEPWHQPWVLQMRCSVIIVFLPFLESIESCSQHLFSSQNISWSPSLILKYNLYFFLLDLRNVSVHLLSTAQVEGALIEHSSVAEAAVVGFAHRIMRTEIYCFVIPKNVKLF